MRFIKDITPTTIASRTNAALSDPGITYNEAGISYNELGVTYGGVYGEQDIFYGPVSVKNTSPRIKMFSDFSGILNPGNTYSGFFDGSDDDVLITDGSYDGLPTGTIEFFFKSSFTAGYQKFIFKDGSIDIGISQDFGSGSRVFGEIGGAGNLGEIGTSNNADGNWHHVAISWDGLFVRGYIDGVFKTKTAQLGDQNTNANNLYLGRRITTEPFNGLMDEFRLSDTARYTTEASFSVQTDDFTTDANTLILIHYNEGSGNPLDSSGNGFNGVAENGMTYNIDVPYVGV